MFHQPFSYKGYDFKNRVILPGLSRCRADPGGIPNEMMKKFYSQRATSAALIITEAMPLSPKVNAWPGGGLINTEEQIAKWKEIINEVHSYKTYFFAGLYHGGRLVHPDFIEGELPVSSSSVQCPGEAHTMTGKKPYAIPKELTVQEIKEIVNEYKSIAANVKKAGFDGIEITCASGTLLDQFISQSVNKRTDNYGGSIQNRARFLFEVIDAMLQVFPANKLGIKFSPVGRSQGMKVDNPKEDLVYLLEEMNKRNLLFAELVEAENMFGETDGIHQIENVAKEGRKIWKGLLISNGFKEVSERLRRINDKEADMIAFGRYYISNPDLVERLKKNLPLAEPDYASFYFGGEKGYVDYPRHPDNPIGDVIKGQNNSCCQTF